MNLKSFSNHIIALFLMSVAQAQDLLKYDSRNEPKAKGVSFSIKYPASWKAEPGERMNIVQRFTSENGLGSEVVTILVKDIPLPQNEKIKESDLDELYSPEGLASFVPKGGTAIKYSETKIDGERAGYVYYIAPFEKANMQLITKAETYMIFYKGKLIAFTFSAGRLKREGEGLKLAQQFERMRPIFQQMAVSIVLNDKWKVK